MNKRVIIVNILFLLLIGADVFYLVRTKEELTLYSWALLYSLLPMILLFVNGVLTGIVSHNNKGIYAITTANSIVALFLLYLSALPFTNEVRQQIINNSEQLNTASIHVSSGTDIGNIISTVITVAGISIFGTFLGGKLRMAGRKFVSHYICRNGLSGQV